MGNIVANVGVPMIFVQWAGMWLALGPIILVEWVVLWASLRGPASRWLGVSGLANFITTLVGIPAAWFLSCLIEIPVDLVAGSAVGPVSHTIMNAAWLPPYEDDLVWMIPLAFMVLLVPAFVVSVLVEAWIARRMMAEIPARRIWSAILRANLVSYLLLFAFCVARLFLVLEPA